MANPLYLGLATGHARGAFLQVCGTHNVCKKLRTRNCHIVLHAHAASRSLSMWKGGNSSILGGISYGCLAIFQVGKRNVLLTK